MKKLLSLVAAIGCFVSASIPSFAQWSTVTAGINYPFPTTSTGVVTIKRVGIGNIAPQGLLSLYNDHFTRKIVLNTQGDNDHQFYGMGTSPDVFRFHIPGPTRAFRFYRGDGTTNSTEIFTILGTGSVCIGTASPGSYKLAVGGKIGAWEEIKVLNPSTAFPDYVFAPSYKLPSLGEVESYIRQNRHLPEVPSAEEVEKEGMGLVEMNTIAIKKIEELTLYLIEQNKRLERQERMLEELQQQNQVLKTENDQIKAAIEGLK